MRRPFALCLFVLGLSTACGGPGKALIPVDSPLLPWEAPEDLAPAEGEAAPAETPAEAPAAEAPAPTK
jgi:hypothetical protein